MTFKAVGCHSLLYDLVYCFDVCFPENIDTSLYTGELI